MRRPCVLFWGRYDPAYSRNSVVMQCFEELGWSVVTFRPYASATGALEANLRRVPSADLVWVPCFRQRDVAAATRYARECGLPICVDPLISAYDKQVHERGKHSPGSRRAERLLAWERALFDGPDRVIVDTYGHAEYFAQTLQVDASNLYVVPVGADEAYFQPSAPPPVTGRWDVLFFGSFLGLQGPQTIIRAARLLERDDIAISLLGEGPEHSQSVKLARGLAGVSFETWLPYVDLPARIRRAHLVLGVFGASDKAGRVIPNKVYQALACSRPVITRRSESYPRALLDDASPGVHFVAPDDPDRLAEAITGFCRDRAALPAAANDAHRIYTRWFSRAAVGQALTAVLDSLGLPAAFQPMR